LSAIAMVIIAVSWISMVALVNNETNYILDKTRNSMEERQLQEEKERKAIDDAQKALDKIMESESSYNYNY